MKNVIFGASGQDGHFLTSLLHQRGETIVGVFPSGRANKLNPSIEGRLSDKYYVDFQDGKELGYLLQKVSPDKIFNLAGFSSVHRSFVEAQECFSINFMFFERLLSAVKSNLADKLPHIFHCSSSEMYASSPDSFIDESSEMKPISPYGISKTASQHLAEVYREAYGLPVSTGILFNHESELRTPTYFSGKAVSGVVDIYLGAATELPLQSLNFSRDWSYAEDVVQAMYLISSLDNPSDFIVASGKLRSGRDFVHEAFTYLGLDEDWERFLTQSSAETRPLDHQGKVGNFKKLNLATGWVPKTEFSKMIEKMIDSELKRRSRE